MRRAIAALVLALAGPVVLSGCGKSDPPTYEGDPATIFNPCTGLHPGAVSKALGETVTVSTKFDDGTPRCGLIPARKNGPVFQISYSTYALPLIKALTASGSSPEVFHEVSIPHARDARLVVTKTANNNELVVTGFLQNGSLVEEINLAAMPPYDKQTILAATKVVLTQLSTRAAALPATSPSATASGAAS